MHKQNGLEILVLPGEVPNSKWVFFNTPAFIKPRSVIEKQSISFVQRLLSFVIIFILIGPIVDLSRTFIAQHQLSHALDITALELGAYTERPSSKVKEYALRRIQTHYSENGKEKPATVDLSFTDDKITIVATSNVPMLLIGYAGIDAITIGANTKIMHKASNEGRMAMPGKPGLLKSAALASSH